MENLVVSVEKTAVQRRALLCVPEDTAPVRVPAR